MRRRQGGDLFVRKAKKKASEPIKDLFGSSIPPESKKRKKEHKRYSEGCKELEAEIRAENNGKIYDFFTGREIQGFTTFHHLLGRSGDYYTDKKLLVPAENDENDGHLFWHHATVEQLKAKPWYKDFLERLKSRSLQAYQKEINKINKSSD